MDNNKYLSNEKREIPIDEKENSDSEQYFDVDEKENWITGNEQLEVD